MMTKPTNRKILIWKNIMFQSRTDFCMVFVFQLYQIR